MPVYQELCFEIHGMDFASPKAGRAPNLEGVTVLQGDICELPVEPGSFDVVACIDVPFHVLDNEKWSAFFVNARKALAKGGLLVIQVSLRDDADYEGIRNHVHFRRRRDYDEAAAAAGLSLVEAHRYVLPVEANHKDMLVYRSQEG